ncbi:hypothetical protein REPUB_Repub10bG0005900 [Reevesia pubescens]
MGCSVSKFDIADEGGAPTYHQFSPLVHRRNDLAVVDSSYSLLPKPLPEGGEGVEHAKDDHNIQHIYEYEYEEGD